MRYLGIDLTRSVAIFIVMIAHAMAATNVTGDSLVFQSLKMSMAPSAPIFICLFGAMLQLVYARKYAIGQQDIIKHRLLTRAFQCWLLYVLSCAIMCASLGYSFAYFIRCSLMMGDTPFTDILKFYAFMLLISPILIHISVTRGLRPLVLFCLLVQFAFPLISQIPPPGDFPGADSVAAILYGGVPTGSPGPSILHGLTFVVFGMVIGRTLQAQNGEEQLLLGHQKWVRYGFILLSALTLSWIWLAGFNFLEASERMGFRNANHPIFYLFGLTTTMLFLEIFIWIQKITKLDINSPWFVFGRTSIFTFCFGNSWLYFIMLNDPDMPPDYALFWGSVIMIFALSYLYSLFREIDFLKSGHPLARTYNWVFTESANQLVSFLMRLLPSATSLIRHPLRQKQALRNNLSDR